MTHESLRLRQLISEIGLPLRRLPEILSMGHKDCLDWWSQKKEIAVSDFHFSQLANLLDINENQLFHGSYDKELARRRLFGAIDPLPERYKINQNSYLRTSAHIMHYITLTRGQFFADQILRGLNISPIIYQNIHVPINLTYFSDLLEALANKGFSQDELDALASVMFLSIQETKLGAQFNICESYFDIYQTLAENFHYFDSNFEYRSSFIGRKYILKTILPLDHHRDIKNQPANVQRLMRYRHILLAWFPYLGGLAPLFPKMDWRQSGGILEVQYELELNSEVAPLAKSSPRTLAVMPPKSFHFQKDFPQN